MLRNFPPNQSFTVWTPHEHLSPWSGIWDFCNSPPPTVQLFPLPHPQSLLPHTFPNVEFLGLPLRYPLLTALRVWTLKRSWLLTPQVQGNPLALYVPITLNSSLISSPFIGMRAKTSHRMVLFLHACLLYLHSKISPQLTQANLAWWTYLEATVLGYAWISHMALAVEQTGTNCPWIIWVPIGLSLNLNLLKKMNSGT